MQSGFKIGLPEVKFGVPAPLFFPGAAINCLGQRAAEWAVLSGKMFSAGEAAGMGLVDAVGDSRSFILAFKKSCIFHPLLELASRLHLHITERTESEFLTFTVIVYLCFRDDTLAQCREVLLRLTRDTHPEVKYMSS